MCRALHTDNRELPESFELLVATNVEPEKVFMKLVTNITDLRSIFCDSPCLESLASLQVAPLRLLVI